MNRVALATTSVAAAAVLAAGLSVTVGCPGDARAPRQVILILLDAARPDRFSCYGYGRPTTPEMDRLAEGGMVFRRHYAQASSTRQSIPSMLYSRYFCAPIFPNSRHVPYSAPWDLFRRPDDAQVSLPMAFEASGFTTVAISAHNWTGEDTPFAAEFVEAHDLSPGLEDRKYGYPRADYAVEYAIRWMREHQGEDFFLYLHLMDTHFPHFFEDDAASFFNEKTYDAAARFVEGGSPRNLQSRLTEDDRRWLDALYDGSMRYTDRHLGRLFQFLRDRGTLENTVVAITADHGENLMEGPGDPAEDGAAVLAHGGPWFERVARIPLILFAPQRLEPGAFPHFSEGVDVAPTLLALAGVDVPPGRTCDGVNLVEIVAGRRPPKSCVLKRRGVRTKTEKCLFDQTDKALLAEPAPEPGQLTGRLYDLVDDPEERENLFAQQPDRVRRLLELYRRHMAQGFARYRLARTERQPRSEFAIAAEYLRSDSPLRGFSSGAPPTGWSRTQQTRTSAVVAYRTNQPLVLQCAMPDGPYDMSVRLQGEAVLEVNGVKRLIRGKPDGMVSFGEIVVDDKRFRVNIQPSGDGLTAIYYVGFTPRGAAVVDEDARLRRLKTLGYVD